MAGSSADLNPWRTITSIGHGAAWAADGYNYDDVAAYPPGFVPGSDSSGRAWAERWRMDQSMEESKGVRKGTGVDKRWATVQGAVLGVGGTPTLTAAWVDIDTHGRVRKAMRSRTANYTSSEHVESSRSTANTSPTSTTTTTHRSTTSPSSPGSGIATPVTEYDYKSVDKIVGFDDIYGGIERKSGLRGEAVGFVSGRREHCMKG